MATNEPWGTYHVADVAPEVESRGGSITLIVPDESEIDPADPVPSLALDQAEAEDFDLLVVNGATQWPAEVAQTWEDLPLVASSTAYLNPEEGEYAAELRNRFVAMTAGSAAEQETFAVHLGVSPQDIEVVGIPELDALPAYRPEPDSVLILTSVTYPDETGGAAPGTELLLETAEELAESGKRVIVGPHPREDPELWSDFEIASEGSLEAAAKVEVAAGIPGSVFPKIAAFGTPLVAVIDEGLEVPDYLTSVAVPASDVDAAVAAVQRAEPAPADALERAAGPVGSAGPALVDLWWAAASR